MAVPTAPVVVPVISGAESGAFHQPVKSPMVVPAGLGIKGASSNGSSITSTAAYLYDANLPCGTVGTSYSQTFTGIGGTAPYTFALASGSLPGGLTLSSSGTISGTPTTAASFTFTVTVTDANNATGSQTLTLVVDAATSPVSASGNYGFVA